MTAHRWKPVISLALLAIGSCATPAEDAMKHEHGDHAHAHHGGHHRFDDAAKWSAVFDAADRDAWQKPDAVIEKLALKPDDVVADIGAGTGYFSMRIARKVTSGKVLAVDIEPTMIEHMRKRAHDEGITNLVAHLGAMDDARLPEKARVAIVVDTAHHIEGRTAYFTKLRAEMAEQEARLVIVEFFADRDGPIGPPRAMRIAPDTLTQELAGAGWTLVDVDVATLPHQYIATYR